MRELRTEIDIDARPEEVWEILMDFARYPDWNPFIRSISGDARVDSTIKVHLKPEGGMAMLLEPKVIAADANRKFAWKGSLLIGGIFDGQHEFILEKTDDGKTKFVHREEFSGILVPLLWRFLEKNTARGFNDMNRALSERATGN